MPHSVVGVPGFEDTHAWVVEQSDAVFVCRLFRLPAAKRSSVPLGAQNGTLLVSATWSVFPGTFYYSDHTFRGSFSRAVGRTPTMRAIAAILRAKKPASDQVDVGMDGAIMLREWRASRPLRPSLLKASTAALVTHFRDRSSATDLFMAGPEYVSFVTCHCVILTTAAPLTVQRLLIEAPGRAAVQWWAVRNEIKEDMTDLLDTGLSAVAVALQPQAFINIPDETVFPVLPPLSERLSERLPERLPDDPENAFRLAAFPESLVLETSL